MTDTSQNSRALGTPRLTDAGSAAVQARVSFYLFAFFVPWIFDYSAETETLASSAIQASIVFTSFLVLFNFMSEFRHLSMNSALKNILILFAIWLIGAIFSGFIQQQEIIDIIKASIAPLLFIVGAIFAFFILSIEQNYIIFKRNMLFIMTAVSLWHAIVALINADFDLLRIRYYILSGVIEIFSAYLVSCYFHRLSGRDLIGGIVHFGIVTISLTRTVALAAIVMLVSPYISRLSLILKTAALRRLLILSLAIFAFASISSGTEFAEAVQNRLMPESASDIGIDPTAATRLAEIDYQVNAMMESTQNTLIGLGIAAVTSLTGDWAILVAMYQGFQVIDLHDRSFGHCQYTGYLFTGGLLFGSLPLIATIYSLVVAFRVVRWSIGLGLDSEVGFIGLWGALGVIGTAVFGLLGGVFANRGHALFYGVVIGMMFWAYGQLKSQADQAPRPTRIAH